MITPELINMGVGLTTGFLFRFMSERAKARDRAFEKAMSMKDKDFEQSEDSKANALARINAEAGKYVRRFLVVAVCFATILAPFILTYLGLPTFIESTETSRGWLWGLVGEKVTPVFVQINGYLLIEEVRQFLALLGGFYFGNAAAK